MITTELVNAVDLADTDEDQSQENLNFVFDIIKSIAGNCSNDNVNSHWLILLFFIVVICIPQCTSSDSQHVSITMALDQLQNWREETLHLQSARFAHVLFLLAHFHIIFPLALLILLKQYTLSQLEGYSWNRVKIARTKPSLLILLYLLS